MPIVTVYHRPDIMDGKAAQLLKDAIRSDGHFRFSHQDLKLSPDDFSFIFVEAKGYDELTHDIIVAINLHAFPEWVDKADENAERMSNVLKDAINSMLTIEDELTIGVALLHSAMGWNSMVLFKNDPWAVWPGDR